MPCLEQFHLRAGSPHCICFWHLHFEPEMCGQMILVSISGTCYVLCKKTSSIGVLVKASNLIPKIRTCPLDHNTTLRHWGPHQLPMCRLYTAPHHSGTLIYCVGTSGTQGEHQFGVDLCGKHGWFIFLQGRILYLIITSLSKQSGGQYTPTYTFGWPDGNLPYLQM